jgi:D-amino-acid dehydrogenase
VLGRALAVAPGLAGATVAEVRVGLRPASADGLPVLGPVPGVDGVVVATGLGAGGLTVGPYVGRLAADLALGRTPPVDLSPYAPARA